MWCWQGKGCWESAPFQPDLRLGQVTKTNAVLWATNLSLLSHFLSNKKWYWSRHLQSVSRLSVCKNVLPLVWPVRQDGSTQGIKETKGSPLKIHKNSELSEYWSIHVIQGLTTWGKKKRRERLRGVHKSNGQVVRSFRSVLDHRFCWWPWTWHPSWGPLGSAFPGALVKGAGQSGKRNLPWVMHTCITETGLCKPLSRFPQRLKPQQTIGSNNRKELDPKVSKISSKPKISFKRSTAKQIPEKQLNPKGLWACIFFKYLYILVNQV